MKHAAGQKTHAAARGNTSEVVGGGTHSHARGALPNLPDHAVVHYGRALRQRCHQPYVAPCNTASSAAFDADSEVECSCM